MAIVSLLIIIHEAGHFIAAIRAGIPIACFSVGIGPKLFGLHWKGTEYRLSLIPLGGYVSPAIENEKDYFAVGFKKRLALSLGGPLANIVIAPPLFALIAAIHGEVSTYSLLAAPFIKTYDMLANIVFSIAGLFAGQGELSSVVGAVAAGGHFIGMGMAGALEFTVAITLNLAIFNLLPLPPLDGGKIVLDTLERAQPKLMKIYLPACVCGWILMFGLMAYATVGDIQRLTA